MPIRAELRHFYGREWREVTRPRILARAGGRCEQCGKRDRARTAVISLPVDGRWVQFWCEELDKPWVRCSDGEGFPHKVINRSFPEAIRTARIIRVVLTVAHLNHVAGDDRDENLKALCQWCHLNYDLGHHHETRARRKDAARPLLTPNQPMKEAIPL